jgi:hypothetical protein
MLIPSLLIATALATQLTSNFKPPVVAAASETPLIDPTEILE